MKNLITSFRHLPGIAKINALGAVVGLFGVLLSDDLTHVSLWFVVFIINALAVLGHLVAEGYNDGGLGGAA